jgi:uncharacterized membrane protein SpoIIM required for sporulation
MNEVRFIKQNGKRWKEFENFLTKRSKINPDHLAQLYVELTDDLSYSQSYFPKSKTTKYLNQLTLQAHQKLFKRKKKAGSGLINFFAKEYPLVLYRHRKYILYSFLIVLVSALIGAFSLTRNEDFARLILGDYYINTTLENIYSGDPMAIYKRSGPLEMFFMIAWNNIKVSFYAFAGGIIFSIGTFLILFKNGVMLGVFQYFFFKEGFALLSMSAIWLHGTIEIFSIIVAGAAGLVMGNSFLFPGTYTRGYSLIKGAKDGSLMVAGLIPFFIIAAFIESFLTRFYMNSILTDWIIIGASMLLIIWYFFMYPAYVNRKINNGQ